LTIIEALVGCVVAGVRVLPVRVEPRLVAIGASLGTVAQQLAAIAKHLLEVDQTLLLPQIALQIRVARYGLHVRRFQSVVSAEMGAGRPIQYPCA
jgi:hypothetical protein